jgi:hypothetical protein
MSTKTCHGLSDRFPIESSYGMDLHDRANPGRPDSS